MNTIKIDLLPKQTLKRKALKTINIVAQVALVINMSMVGAIIVPERTGAAELAPTGTLGAVCDAGDVKYEVGSGYEYTDGSATINVFTVPGDAHNRVSWQAAPGYNILSICIKIGGQGGSLIQVNPVTNSGEDGPFAYDISHVVITTESVQTRSLRVIKHVDNDGDGIYEEHNPIGWTWDLDNVNTNYDMGHTEWVTTGWHHVKEDQQPGYHADGWYCCNGTSGPGEELDVNIQDDLVCEFWNTKEKGSLKVIKHVDNGTATPDQWDFTVAGQGTKSPNTGENFVIFDDLPAGSYTATESTVPGYHPVSTTCNDVAVVAGQQAVCEFHNTKDTECDLEITKSVDLQAAYPGDILTYTINYENVGDAVCTGTGVKVYDELHTYLTYVAGSKTIQIFNDGEGDGYHATQGNDYNGKTNTLLYNVNRVSPGESGVITLEAEITDLSCGEYDIPNKARIWSNETGNIWSNQVNTHVSIPCGAELTVIKHVINDDGGTAVATDFTMNVTGTNVSNSSFPGNESGTTVTLDAGSYSVDENYFSGYAKTIGANCSGSIADGEHKTCTITNNDKPATLTLIKHVINDDGGTKQVADFPLFIDATQVTSGVANSVTPGTYTASETEDPGYQASAWGGDCAAAGAVTIALGEHKVCEITNDDISSSLTLIKHVINDDGGTLGVADFNLYVDSTQVTSGVAHNVAPGTYTASEDTSPGYSASPWSVDCAPDGTVTVQAGEHKVCHITNDDMAPQLTVIKHVINDDGGTAVAADFTMNVTGTNVSNPSFPGDESGTTVTLNQGSYVVDEVMVSGYAKLIGADCVGTINVGESKTCTITNDDEGPTITLVKAVINDNGGTAGVNDFGLTIGATAVTSGQTLNVMANTSYALDEAGLAGYSFVSLTGDEQCPEVLGGEVTLGLDEHITCTITNDDIAPELTVIKHVINDDGGTAVAADFLMNVTGTNVSNDSFDGVESPGVTVTLDQGSYSVDEVEVDGYAKTLGADCSGTINVGEQKTCTITNDDIAPTLTLIKNVINDNGGTKEAADFELFIDSLQVASGVTETVMANVQYTASENEDADYTASDWSGDCAADGTVTLLLGENKTCEITNNDIPEEKTYDPVLGITKAVNVEFTNPGKDVTYTATVTNNGKETAFNVILDDDLPNGFTFVDGGDNIKSWELGDMKVGDEITKVFDAHVDSNEPAGIYNNVACTKADNHGQICATAPVEIRIPKVLAEEADPELTIDKSVNVEYTNPGNTITYTLVIRNIGDGVAEDVEVVDTLPDGFTFADTGVYSRLWELGDMVPDEERIITYDVKVDVSVKAGVYENLAIVSAKDLPDKSDKTDVEVRIPEVLGAELPDTGGNGMWYLISGLMLIIMGVGITMYLRKNSLPRFDGMNFLSLL
ncbi:MAG: LPXTG cell wall anchor domain-containing protein [Patescibacteria group bacterium]